MTQEIDKIWHAEARTQETKQLIRDIKRITRRKFTAEEKIRIVLEGFRRGTPIRDICPASTPLFRVAGLFRLRHF